MKQKTFLIAGFIASLFLAGVVSFYASSNPDGLEKVAGDIGFSETAKENTNSDGILADYGVKGIDNPRLSTGAAGVVGVVATAAISTGLFALIRRKSGGKK
jgi:cobalt/nickel transport protein|uniref:PDGLE domain-containing protein n=1 Tax=Candidatus Planktophila sp. TaxID=2175601 RepID=UPI00404B5BD2